MIVRLLLLLILFEAQLVASFCYRKAGNAGQCDVNTCYAGRCVQEGELNYCRCYPGWQGDACGEMVARRFPAYDWMDCGRGVCIIDDGGQQRRCECEPGFTGHSCKELASRTLPDNFRCEHGIIIRHGDVFECACDPGFSGEACDRELTEDSTRNGEVCTATICLGAESRCEMTVEGHPVCLCERGREGRRCEDKRPDPFSHCPQADYCSRAYGDGHCDEMCNNELCLFDGFDCLRQRGNATCPEASQCSEKFADGTCDAECNREECAFDGGDCEGQRSRNELSGRLILRLDRPPTAFLAGRRAFLHGLSTRLRARVTVEGAESGYGEVYEWFAEAQMVGRRVTEKTARYSLARSTEVHLIVDISPCTEHCFSSVELVSEFIKEEVEKKALPSLGIADSLSAPRKARNENESRSRIVYVVVIVVVVAVILIGVATAAARANPRSRKRVLQAGIYPIPTYEDFIKPLDRSPNVKRRLIEVEEEGTMTGRSERRTNQQPSTTYLHQLAYGDGPLALRNACDIWMVNYRDEIGRTPLHCLAASEFTRKSAQQASADCSWLIHMGVDVNAKDKNSDTALHLAIATCRLSLVQKLIDQMERIDPAMGNAQDKTPLHLATENGDVLVVRLLLEHRRVLERINATDVSNRTALVLSVINNHPDAARVLLQKGADPNFRGDMTYTETEHCDRAALHYAAAEGLIELIRILTEAGGDVNVTDGRRRTPLYFSVYYGKIECVRQLVALGANKDIADDEGTSAYMLAQRYQQTEIIDLFHSDAVRNAKSGKSRKRGRKTVENKNRRRSNDTGYCSEPNHEALDDELTALEANGLDTVAPGPAPAIIPIGETPILRRDRTAGLRLPPPPELSLPPTPNLTPTWPNQTWPNQYYTQF